MVTTGRPTSPTAPTPLEAELIRLAGAVPDPELPVISLAELGVLRGIRVLSPDPDSGLGTGPGSDLGAGGGPDDGRMPSGDRLPGVRVEVELTPTWTGCPALDTMATDITEVLTAHGVAEVAVRTVLAPAWSTDEISAEGRRKLAEAGVAPPRPQAAHEGRSGPVALELAIRCPHCGSTDTRLLSRFSSTACKALRRCESCREPFDHFKEV